MTGSHDPLERASSPAVRQLFPASAAMSVGQVLSATEPSRVPLTFADEKALDFLARLSRQLLAPPVSRAHPEFAALGSFLRPRHIRRFLDERPTVPDARRHPVGRALHFPPANVDTVFVYSWAMSMAAGNTNVVRLSERAGAAASALIESLESAAQGADPGYVSSQVLVTYPRDSRATEDLSAGADLRVVWGGDGTVEAIRRIAMPPNGRDLSFPDRSSLAVLSAGAWQNAADDVREDVAHRVYREVTLFDQAACSSPKTVVWVGDEGSVARAADELALAVTGVARRADRSDDASTAVERRVLTYGMAVEGSAKRIRHDPSGITSLHVDPPGGLNRRWLGPGTLAFARVEALVDVASWIGPQDQTLTHFGFDRQELEALDDALGRSGVRRIVPLGDALLFHPVWDGYDLVAEFTRLRVLL